MGSYVVQVEYSDLKHAVVRAETEIGNDQNRGELKENNSLATVHQCEK
jgi:hypothetical protein